MSQNPDDGIENSRGNTRQYFRTTSTNPFDKRTPEPTQQESYSRDEDLYEEPDRDTDSSAGFYEHSIEDDEIDIERAEDTVSDNLFDDLTEENSLPISNYSAQPTLAVVPDPVDSYIEPGESDSTSYDDDLDDDDPHLDDGLEDDWDDEHLDDEMAAAEEQDVWLEERAYAVDESDSGQAWPLGLIAVAVLALILLVAGGYGVIQQRSATQEEIRELRAALATAASPQEVSESRNTAAEFEQRNIQLKEQLFNLSAENRRLKDTVAGLEVQLAVQQKSTAPGSSKPTVAAAPTRQLPAAKPAAKPTTPARVKKAETAVVSATPVAVAAAVSKPAAASQTPANGRWFVNFGSYGQSSAAQSWATKLQPEQGQVITAPGVKNGRTFYRVRVIGLQTKEAAEKVARTLEREYGLPKLWIGQQG